MSTFAIATCISMLTLIFPCFSCDDLLNNDVENINEFAGAVGESRKRKAVHEDYAEKAQSKRMDIKKILDAIVLVENVSNQSQDLVSETIKTAVGDPIIERGSPVIKRSSVKLVFGAIANKNDFSSISRGPEVLNEMNEDDMDLEEFAKIFGSMRTESSENSNDVNLDWDPEADMED
jgi:hypothetical protein